MYKCTYDNFNFVTNDVRFFNSIKEGRTQPYSGELNVVKKYMKENPTKNVGYIDIGAHIGTTVLPYSKLFKHCWAYEANKDNFIFLQQNVSNNNINNVSLYNLAVHDKETKGNITKHGANSGCFMFKEDMNGITKTAVLDNEKLGQIDFIKCDIEGSEYLALKGAREILKKYKPLLQIEINNLSVKNFRINNNTLHIFLKELDYELYQHCNDYFYYVPDKHNVPNKSDLTKIPSIDTLSISKSIKTDYIKEKVIFCFWTGTNLMSERRKKSIQNLIRVSQCNVRLITVENLEEYLVEPLHEAYNYLSYVHRADYLRTYFMHFHGGGYSDIKSTPSSWNKAFDDMFNSNKLINSYHEIKRDAVAGPPRVKNEWQRLAGNGSYIVRPLTKFTTEWIKRLHKVLDDKLPTLKKMNIINFNFRNNSPIGYPIKWTELLGDIYHPLLCNYLDDILFTVPHPICTNYK